MLERNKLDWSAISALTHASFLSFLLLLLCRKVQCSQTPSMTAQWRGSYLHLLTWTSLVLPFFKSWLPLRCQTSLSVIYTHLLRRCAATASPPTDINKQQLYGFYSHLRDSKMLMSTSIIKQWISGFPHTWSQDLRLSVLSWDSLPLQNAESWSEWTDMPHLTHAMHTHAGLCILNCQSLQKFSRFCQFQRI